MPDESQPTRAVRTERVKRIVAPTELTDPPARVWTDEQWERIQLGYRPYDMDEKWKVFAEGRIVYIHRSWKGRGIYEATFAQAEGGWRIASAIVESDGSCYRRRSDEYDRVMLELVLSSIVLGEPATELREALVELQRTESGSQDLPTGVVLHSSLGLRSGN